MKKLQMVRLIAATLASAGSACFVVLYTTFSVDCIKNSSEHHILINAMRWLAVYDLWLFVFPVVYLVAGIWLLRARLCGGAAFEILISVAWLSALGFSFFAILAWQGQISIRDGIIR